MAKQAKLKIGGDASDAVREVAKLESSVQRLQQQLSGVKRASRDAGRARTSAFGTRAVSQLRGFVTGLIGVGGVVQALRMARDEMRATAAAGQQTRSPMQAAVAGAGDSSASDRIAADLRTMQGPGAAQLGMAERSSLYEAVRGSLPLASRERVLALTARSAGYQVISGNVAGTRRVAGFMGELSKMMPTKSIDDLADMAALAAQAAGKHGGELDKRAAKGLQQVVAQGVDPERAMALMIAAQEAGQGGRALSSYASYLSRGRRGTMEASVRAMLDQFERRDYMGMVSAAQSGDLFESQMSQALESPDISAATLRRTAAARKSLAEYDARREALDIESTRDLAEAVMREKGIGAARRWANLSIYDLLTSVGMSPDTAAGGLAAGSEIMKASSALEDAVARGASRGALGPTLSPPREVETRRIGIGGRP